MRPLCLILLAVTGLAGESARPIADLGGSAETDAAGRITGVKLGFQWIIWQFRNQWIVGVKRIIWLIWKFRFDWKWFDFR